MKLFLLQRIEQATEYYHPEGGLVIVANNDDHARAIIMDMEHIAPTDEEWSAKTVYDLAGDYPPKVYVFEDSGCCG